MRMIVEPKKRLLYPDFVPGAIAIFFSAWLLFLVQPVITKQIIPVLGGAPQVWNTHMVFFQFCLLMGYLLSHFILKIPSAKAQLAVYLLLLGVSFFFLPLKISAPHLDPSYAPVSWLLSCLLHSLAFPFLLLSMTNTLVQGWIMRRNPGANPYVLYAASNAGSLLALASFFVLELLYPLPVLRAIWSAGFLLFAALIMPAGCYFNLRGGVTVTHSSPSQDVRPAPDMRASWLLLAFIPSALFLSVTTYITTDVASIPLFWVVPLVIYLITFIVAFSPGQRGVDNAIYGQVALITLVATLIALRITFLPLMLLHLFCLYAIALSCHGTLARIRPHPAHLSEYYLYVSLGGVMGGIFCSLVAPGVFNSPVEYPLLLIAAALLNSHLPKMPVPIRCLRRDLLIPMAILGFSLWGYDELAVASGAMGRDIAPLLIFAGFAWLAVVAALANKRYGSFAMFACVLLCLSCLRGNEQLLYLHRNFFGTSKVFYDARKDETVFTHGTTLHGLQSLRADSRLALSSYYGPLKDIYAFLDGDAKRAPVALVGLGAGTSLCLSKAVTQFDIFEINPDVIHIAGDPALFTYMRDCPGAKNTIVGDARIKIALAPDSRYGFMIMDAFSSDTIPVHLLTREAMTMYLRKLVPGGVIAFHISNRNFNLAPLFAATINVVPLEGYVVTNLKPKQDYEMSSVWVVLTRSLTTAQKKQAQAMGWSRLHPVAGKVWTDQYSDIFPYLQ